MSATSMKAMDSFLTQVYYLEATDEFLVVVRNRKPTRESRVTIDGAASSTSKALIEIPRLTPEEVRAKWRWFLTAFAIAERATSVLAGAILAGVWEWDRNHDGIPDHLQQPRSLGVGK